MISAIIFDMDGVIVDSEPFWQQAEKTVFTALGVKVTDELSLQTQIMTTAAVTQFWYDRYPWNDVSHSEVEARVVDSVIESIQNHDCIMPGLKDSVTQLKKLGIKLGLATNSPYRVIPKVLEKAGLSQLFDAIVSAEQVKQGKPAPDVYLSALKQLAVDAADTWAIEDSNSGARSALAAGLQVIGFGPKPLKGVQHQIDGFHQLDVQTLHKRS